MTAEQRREAILNTLKNSDGPCNATALAKTFGVSRQVVVTDVALLRAFGAAINATPRGYVMDQGDSGLIRRIACCHAAAQMEDELCIIVDNGCTVLDVVVEHPVYGELVGALQLKSRYDVSQFILQSHKARPLSLLTEGVHLHTIACPDEEAYRRVREALGAAGYLLAT